MCWWRRATQARRDAIESAVLNQTTQARASIKDDAASIEIQKHIAVSDQQYSVLQMLFLLAYSVMYAGGGRIADWLGTRKGYSILILFCSSPSVIMPRR